MCKINQNRPKLTDFNACDLASITSCFKQIFLHLLMFTPNSDEINVNPCRYEVHERPPKSYPSHSSVFILCIPSPQYAFRQPVHMFERIIRF